MFKIKNILTLALFTAFMTSGINAHAQTSNDLLRMDIKRSSMNDAVDVTFYTTGNSTNSVVSRKGTNRYVVLLPNVAGSQSVAPSIGGVKDLITDIDVKNVDDGLGGYTKVTFTTTKPVKIQTATKQTIPLTQAQQDYKNLISKNNKYDPENKMEAFKSGTNAAVASKAQAASTKPVSSAPASKVSPVKQPATTPKPVSAPSVKVSSSNTKPAVNNVQNVDKDKSVKNVSVQSANSISTSKTASASVAKQPPAKVENKSKQNKTETSKVSASDNIAQKQTDAVIDKTETTKELKKNIEHITSENKQTLKTDNNLSKNNINQKKSKSKRNIYLLALLGATVVAGIFFILALIRAVSNAFSPKNNDSRFFDSNKKEFNSQAREFQNIIEDENLNWQEKYKRYTNKEESDSVSKPQVYSFVTNIADKKNVIIPKDKEKKKEVISSMKTSIRKKVTKPRTKKEVIDVVTSQLEHSFNSAPSLDLSSDENKNDVNSEENVITNKMSKIKLRSFAKSKTLNQANRTLLDKKVISDPLQESRFVKLKNSALSISRRRSASSELNISDLIRSGNKYLNNNSGVVKMDEKQENYLLSSLDEYLSILDNEDDLKTKASEAVAQTLSQTRSNNVMGRSGITNPIEKSRSVISETPSSLNGLVVKSGYNIDNEKGFYLVDLDGISALVGRINENVFVLKRFDRIINGNLQVRLDYGSVYIVRVGNFKCLVDVSKDKMGTLLEI